MTGTSLAAVLTSPGKIEMQEIPLPEIGPDDGLMKIEATGVCGSDIHLHQSIQVPMILGHECVGKIVALGERASKRWGLQEGDRVVIEEPYPCGRCHACRSVNYQLCMENGRYGVTPLDVKPALWGGYSQYMYLHPNSLLYKIADHVPAEIAPMFIPISNGIRWVQQVGGAGIGDTVVIQGPGQHGLGCVIAAKEAGAGNIIVIGLERDQSRLALAKELGAHHVVAADLDDPVEQVRTLTGGALADLVLDVTAGSTQPLNMALDMVKIGGTIVLAGAKNRPVDNFMSDKIFRRELTLRGVAGRDFRAVKPAIQLIESNKYPLEKLATHHFTIQETELALKVFKGEVQTGVDPIHVTVIP